MVLENVIRPYNYSRVKPSIRTAFSKESEIQLSVISPVLNEQDGIIGFLDQISNVLKSLKISYEIILVDDGSKDHTVMKIKSWAELNRDSKVILVRHFVNRGHTISLNSALQNATGIYVLSMDSDLQHPSEIIREFWKHKDSADVIVGNQVTRKSSFYREPFAKLFYSVVRLVSGIPIIKDNGDFRLIKRDLLNAISNSNLFWKPIRFLIPKYGITTRSIYFEAAPRKFGKSKYSFKSLTRFGFNSLLYSTNRPLLFSVGLSLLFSISSLVQIGFLLSWYLKGIAIPGWTTIVFTLTLGFAGVALSLAIISLYLVKAIESVSYGSNNYGQSVEILN